LLDYLKKQCPTLLDVMCLTGRLEGSVHAQLLNKGSSCCHATEFEPIKVTYYDGNGVLKSEWLEGAVATKCACS